MAGRDDPRIRHVRAQLGPTDYELADPAGGWACENPVGHGRLSDRSHAGLWIEFRHRNSPSSPIRSDWDRPSRHTDHPAMMSNSRWATLVSKASSPGRLSHPPGATDVVEDRPPPTARASQSRPAASCKGGSWVSTVCPRSSLVLTLTYRAARLDVAIVEASHGSAVRQ